MDGVALVASDPTKVVVEFIVVALVVVVEVVELTVVAGALVVVEFEEETPHVTQFFTWSPPWHEDTANQFLQ